MAWNVDICETPGQKNHINNRKMCNIESLDASPYDGDFLGVIFSRKGAKREISKHSFSLS